MKSKHYSEPFELSRPLARDKIPANGIIEVIVADEKERKALARRFGLLDLKRLEANLDLRPARGGVMFEVTGHMEADLTQQCVVTLEPLPVTIDQEIDVLFADEELLEPGTSPPHEAPETKEETEAIVNGILDLGELVAQYLGSSLDPYPRKAGVAFVETHVGDEESEASPFAKLAELGKKPGGKER